MKKLTAILLAGIIIFSACNTGEPPAPILPETETDDAPPIPPMTPEPDFAERLAALDSFEPRTEIINRYNPYPAYEFIPGDYGRLYPFPAIAGNNWSVLHGFMTADGRIVQDGRYDNVSFIDLDEGYYIMDSMIPREDNPDWWQREITVMTLDGSRSFSTPNHVVLLGDRKIRVFERCYDEGGEYIGVFDLDGNIISPFVHNSEYAWFGLGTSWRDYGLYVHRETLEAFTDMDFQTSSIDPVSISLGENDELSMVIKYKPEDGWFSFGHLLGVTAQVSDNVFLTEHLINPNLWERKTIVTDKDGSVLLEIGSGYGFIGNVIRFWDPDRYFDYDMNEIFGLDEYGFMQFHVEGDVYRFGKWDDDYTEQTITHVNIKTNEIVPQADRTEPLPGFNWVNPLPDGFFSVRGNGFMGVVNEDLEWIIRIDMLKFID
jgi:hypothetical protein